MMTTLSNQLSRFLKINEKSIFPSKKFSLYYFSYSWGPKDSNGTPMALLLMLCLLPIYLGSYSKSRIFKNIAKDSLWYCGYHIQNILDKVHGQARSWLLLKKWFFKIFSTIRIKKNTHQKTTTTNVIFPPSTLYFLVIQKKN